ncbi:MAG: sulfatase-like hydrolase/transferase [Myxococcota bacterium]|nr:sulfatase-like hydrolase/transferase [Myxococcota bacterium]
MPDRLKSAARWLAPSAACACAGALAAGLTEATGAEDVVGAAAAIGFLALIVFPALFVLSAIARGIYAAWQPDTLGLVEDDGGAPRLVGWIVVVLLGCLLLAWALFQGTWVLNAWTAFKPLTLSFMEPIIAITAALLAVAGSRPAARLFTFLARKADRKVRRGPRSILRPRNVIVGGAVIALATVYTLWRLTVKPRIGPLDISVLYAPALAIVVLLLAHAVWRQLPKKPIVGGALGALTAATIAAALVAVHTRPSLTLEIWGEQPLAGVAIEKLFDLDAIRARISLAEFRPVDKPGSPHPDIILITIDTVRADHTPPYGGEADMPILKELGARGTVFLYAFAPSNVTRRSIPSLVTGLQPNHVRGRVVGWALRIDPRHVLLAERLRAGGYETAGFMCCKGFWGPEARTGLSRGLEVVHIEQNGQRLAKAARAWLDQRERSKTKKPLFLWMHILEPHNWTGGVTEPTTLADRHRMYDRSLTAADGMMREVVGAFVERAPELAPIVVVTADHGEGLGDHGAPYHSTDLYNSQIRVPFVITGPGIKPGNRVAETVSLTDITPTLVELAGFVPPTDKLDGRSVADLASGARLGSPEEGVAFAAMIKDRSNPGGVTAVVRGNWKLIDNGVSYELYDVKSDPFEAQNLYMQKPAVAAELKKLLAERAADRDPF